MKRLTNCRLGSGACAARSSGFVIQRFTQRSTPVPCPAWLPPGPALRGACKVAPPGTLPGGAGTRGRGVQSFITTETPGEGGGTRRGAAPLAGYTTKAP